MVRVGAGKAQSTVGAKRRCSKLLFWAEGTARAKEARGPRSKWRRGRRVGGEVPSVRDTGCLDNGAVGRGNQEVMVTRAQ